MPTIHHILYLSLLLPGLAPAQNLITPGLWQPGPRNPALANILQDNAQGLAFNPACQATTPCTPRPWTGVFQNVTLRQAGLYQLEFYGVGGGSGSFPFEIVVDGRVLWKHRQDGHILFSQAVQLAAGSHRIEFRSEVTSYQFPDSWSFSPPILRPAQQPAIQLRGYTNVSTTHYLVATAPANLLAVSFRRSNVPIRIPGVGHVLNLDPASLVVVARSGTANLRADFSPALPPIYQWPKAYLQAATWSRFGSMVQTRF